MSHKAHSSGETVYPGELRERNWWVNWVLAYPHDNRDAYATKQPVAPYDHGNARPCLWNATIPEEDHPATNYETPKEWEGLSIGADVEAPERVISDELGLGVIIPVGGGEGEPITLLDWDDVRDPETGEVHPVCAQALEECDGFAEISQSGEGIHQFVFGTIPGGMKKFLRHIDDEAFVGDSRPMIEMYSSGRLTAMTGDLVEGAGRDVVDGQDLIDRLCWEFGRASNNSTDTPTDPFATDREDSDSVPSHAEIGEAMRKMVEYDGEDPEEWSIPRTESVEYHAVLRARERSDELPNTANWELLGYAAALGRRDGLSREEIVGDLVERGSDKARAEKELRGVWHKMENGGYEPPSVPTLKRRGILPTDYVNVDELATDDTLTPQQVWEAWSDARESGDLSSDSIIPTAALWHVAKDWAVYDFDALPEDVDKLPAKAYNQALFRVKKIWWPEVNGAESQEEIAELESATARDYRERNPEEVYTWEDVRYIYDGEDGSNGAKRGRHAAEILLRSRYSFMTVQEMDQLHVYDEEAGIYTPHTADVRGEIHDGLGEEWSTHELNEITARLKQYPVIEPRYLNGRAHFDDPHLCVGNGVLNLFTRELKEFSPDYHFVDRIPTKYDEDADTAAYEEVLDDWTGREEDALAMMEMVGHALVPDAHERGYKKFLILHGDANNGKSVFYDRVGDLLNGPSGEEGNTANVKLEKLASNRFSKNSIYGSMANIAGEIDGKWIHNTADLKDITGGDAQEIEPKGGDSFFDAINSTLMFAANDPPKLGVRDAKAIATRIVPVELPYTFTSNPQDPMEKEAVPEQKLTERLTTEEALSGFLNLALDGIERLEENWGDVSLPESEMERYKLYNQSADPMTEFGSVCLENAPDDYIVKADITAIYKQYATANGYDLGTNPHDTLHKVLKSLPDLNYADSYPRKPDYSDTSLPLRAWDERKYAVKRVTLTEEGLHYAEEAGLVVKQPDEEEEQEEPTPALAALEPGAWYDVEAKFTVVSDGDYSDVAKGQVKGPHGTSATFVIPGGNDNVAEGLKGETVRLENVALGTDDDGFLQFEINDDVNVVRKEGNQSGLDTKPQVAQAATDGGEEESEESDDEQPEEEAEADEESDSGTKQLRALSLDLAEFIGDREVSDHELWTAWAEEHDLDDPKGTIEQIVTRHDHVGELKDGVYRSLL